VPDRIEKIRHGVESYYAKKGMKANFHGGFVDLNPEYEKARHDRAVKLAKKWQSKVGEKLLVKHDEFGLKIFNDYLKEGNKLSIAELKKLKEHWKEDYVKA